ncbi:multiple epidermal growth factor-like domains protein 10 [Saccostrea cucullata]|uniref:multiple epidermal growth factor-like domains protein 10 n=1 Tax=Saccostrea cuccullata TaxID=36930 RepID=UPI002ED44233
MCRITFGTENCSTNFQKVGGVCEECPPGYFGLECKQSCPPPTFGKLCGDTCYCAHNECNPTYGCSKEEKDTKGCAVGSLKENNQKCCSNHYKVNHTCQACPPGYFDLDCSSQCPPSRYGFMCAYLCNCSNSYCNHVTGCLLTRDLEDVNVEDNVIENDELA